MAGMVTAAAQLQAQLRDLGLRSGALVMVHASLRAVGPVEGRAGGLIDAILDVIGPDGTMVMALGADADEPFEAQRTEVDIEDMGVLAEVFRTHPGTRVSDHAASRWAASGPLAPALLRDPPLHDYHGPGSLLERFVARGGVVLRLGADVDTMTLTHLAEYRARVPDKRRVRIRYVRADVGEQWIESLDDTDGIVEDGDYFEQILIDFIAAGRARRGAVGRCQAELLDGQEFLQFAVDWMERELGTGRW